MSGPDSAVKTIAQPNPPSKLTEITNRLIVVIDNFERTSNLCQDLIDTAEGDSPREAGLTDKGESGPGIMGTLSAQCSSLDSISEQLRQRVEYLQTII